MGKVSICSNFSEIEFVWTSCDSRYGISVSFKYDDVPEGTEVAQRCLRKLDEKEMTGVEFFFILKDYLRFYKIAHKLKTVRIFKKKPDDTNMFFQNRINKVKKWNFSNTKKKQ